MRYNEPEGHLDALVDEVVALPGVSPRSRICGLTYKESTTLERFHQRGFLQVTELSSSADFQITDASAGLETIQARITPGVADALVERHGTFDVVLVRHLLEHSHDLTNFLAAVRRLAATDGYIIFEVPDCTTMFSVTDYSFLWEDHISYFTPTTLARTLRQHRLHPQQMLTYPYALENSLVAITSRNHASPSGGELPGTSSIDRYAASFPHIRDMWTQKLTELKQQGPIAILGAGHLAVTFINLLGVEPLIDYVCDDAADKVNRIVPGTQLRISPSQSLLQHSVNVCLMAVAVESEPKVLTRNQEFIQRGGRFASIFGASEYALQLDSANNREPGET